MLLCIIVLLFIFNGGQYNGASGSPWCNWKRINYRLMIHVHRFVFSASFSLSGIFNTLCKYTPL